MLAIPVSFFGFFSLAFLRMLLYDLSCVAGMAELADALVSGISGCTPMQVQVLFPAPDAKSEPSRQADPVDDGSDFSFISESWGST